MDYRAICVNFPLLISFVFHLCSSLGIVDEDSLFERLETAAKEDKTFPENMNVKQVFGTWSNQKGFPLLKVMRNYSDGSMVLHQEKYDAIWKPNNNESSTWWIPYNFASANNPEFNVTTPFGWLRKNQQKMVIEPKQNELRWTNDDWLIFNRQQTAYYRVLYDDENYDLISKELNDGDLNKIHAINRAQILDDLHDFVKSGRVSPDILCDILIYLKKETSNIPWTTADRVIMDWNRNLQVSNKLRNFRMVMAPLLESNYEKWTLNETENEQMFDKIARERAVRLACSIGMLRCFEDTYTKFHEFINGIQISQNIRGLAIMNGIRSASIDEITKLWQILLNTSHGETREEIISSFCNIPEASTVEFYLNKSFEHDNDIRASERLLFVTSIIGNGPKGVSLVIQFLLRNSQQLSAIFGLKSTILESIAEQILSTEMETEVTEMGINAIVAQIIQIIVIFQFYQLLDLAKQKNLINERNIALLKYIAAERLEWRKNYMKIFEDNFFVGKCGEN